MSRFFTCAVLQGHTGPVRSASFSPNGHRVLTGSDDTTARLWDADTGWEIVALKGYTTGVESASFSPDGRRVLVLASAYATVGMWDGESGQRVAVLQGHTTSVASASFSPDGHRVATTSDDYTARLWGGQDGEPIAVLRGHRSMVRSASFSPDVRRLVTASEDNTARLWGGETGEAIAILKGHTDVVWSAAFGRDGRRVVTGSNDSTVRFWDAEAGLDIAVLRSNKGLATVALSPDGRLLFTGSDESTARLWDVSRTDTIVRDRAVTVTAALACGIGWCTDAERADLLMQDAAEQFNAELFAEAKRQLLDPQEHSPVEIAQREQLLEQTIAALRAPLHPNCYLSPSQFAEKFGLPLSAVSAPTGLGEHAREGAAAEDEAEATPASNIGNGANAASVKACAEPAVSISRTIPNASAESTATSVFHHWRSWALWLALSWALAATVVASLR